MTTNNPNPVFIALCGATGTGKSTFINDASGAELPVGHSPSSCTIDVEFAPRFELDGRQIQLIDTPGFDDTTVSDAEILQKLGDFLKLSHLDNQHLSGIIYMHRITDNRVGGMSRRNFHVFREICGENTLKNVVITTNMWKEPYLQSELDREKHLRENPLFFQPAVAKGARMARYVRSRGANAAHDLIRMLVNNTPLPTYLGGALADDVPLGQTNAGKALNEELLILLEKQKVEIEALKKQMEDAIRKRNKEAKEELEEEKRESEKRHKDLSDQIRNLNTTMEGERKARKKERAEDRAAHISEQAKQESQRVERELERDEEIERLRRELISKRSGSCRIF